MKEKNFAIEKFLWLAINTIGSARILSSFCHLPVLVRIVSPGATRLFWPVYMTFNNINMDNEIAEAIYFLWGERYG